jgi:hypothetical protein
VRSGPDATLLQVLPHVELHTIRAAVPVLIGIFGNTPARNDVCGALRTLTHQAWCDDAADDPAATRRQWLRRWNENGSTGCTVLAATDSLAAPLEITPVGMI